MKRSRKKLTPFAKKLLLILVIVTLIFIYKNKIFKIKDKLITNTSTIFYEDYITDSSEKNPNIIKEYITKGMSLKDLEKKINSSKKYITNTDKYKKVYYDFKKHLKYKELEKIYINLALSNIVKLEIIGTSYDGRNIYSLEIGEEKTK